ncbi:EAL domain-containing protein [Rhodoplanes sp. TEM]|uniref:EAL domain-containing protein n=1 Tax=Rhodoplanes tepidamans TaxID=200616 RepID=A0ABT5J838_RHOTP|nr:MULTISPECIES: EAL domain-containing protein [Rhodoplanes]MDC7785814.1 EAL domain-containing protein [Rhodoplanes tepidamans]MDC7984081.1 EAL domain-containing protein [Rhodoplanes sp. TEM]MDQ0354623.1 diguanylate cyclase (GGDEF)-like protein [Rhodoplanes tepidamans]
MSRSWTFRALSAAAVLVLGLATGGVGVALYVDREHEVRGGLREVQNVAVVLAGQLTSSIQAVDIVLRELQARLSTDVQAPGHDAPAIPDPQAFRLLMLERLAHLSQAFGITVTDSVGRVVLTTARWPTPDLDLSDREYFLDLQAHDDDRLSTPLPVRSRINGAQTLVLARRLNGADGRFLGIVYVSLAMDYFARVYRPVERLNRQVFTFARADGRVFIRYPDSESRTGTIVPLNSPWHDVVANGGGTYWSWGLFDGRPRWVAVQPLDGYPFVVNVSVEEADVLAPWRQRSLVVGAATLAFLVAATGLLVLMVRQYRRTSASEASLAEKSQALVREHAELLAHQAALQLQNQRFDAALNNMTQGLAMFDRSACLVVCNERYREIYGIPSGDTVPGTPLYAVIAACADLRDRPESIEKVTRAIRERTTSGSVSSHEFTLGNGRTILVANQPMEGGGWLSTHEDVTDRRQAEEKIRRLAHSDLLTGVANRSHFLEQMATARRRLEAEERPFTVLMLDLDRFKPVNDTLGHAAGDIVLKEIAGRLQKALRADDVLARLGGDEFAVIQSPPRDFAPGGDWSEAMHESAVVLASRIVDLVDEPFDIDGTKVSVGASIGIAMAPKDATRADELMKKADLALYAIKGNGRNGFAFFDTSMAAEADERHRLEIDFRAGLARGEFELHYQPIVEAGTRRLVGREALIRWNHPDEGLIAPDRFIAMAEDTGLVGALGEWILQTACAEAATWPDDATVAVNISPVQFRKTNLLDVIMCALVDSGLPPERLEIEITERVLLEWEADHVSTLHQLKNLGVSIALDDFGTGYSSLSYLTTFPFDKLKIDRCFTRDLLARDGCGAIVCAIVNLGRSLDMVTVAEGVETETQLRLLRAAGVDQVQGYLVGRPAPATALVAAPAPGAAPAADAAMVRSA